MTRTGTAIIAAALALIAVRIAAAGHAGPWWGINAFHYLTTTEIIAWTGAGAVLFFIPILAGSAGLKLPSRFFGVRRLDGAFFPGGLTPGHMAASSRGQTKRRQAGALHTGAAAGLAGLIVFIVLLALPHAATPLLGDGLDRVEALPAGWKVLRGQPAPLDLLLHLGAYRLASLAGGEPFSRSWQTWQWSSCLFGGLAAAALWAWAGLRTQGPAEKIMLFLMTFISGTALFFLGYPENYVSQAAAVPALLLLLELVARKRAPAWSLIIIMTVMTGLHFFAALLIPALLWTLHRRRLWTPGRAARIALAAAAAIFILISIIMVQRHFHGLGKIFIAPAAKFSGYHLIGFLNQQILAAPLLPLLAPLAILPRRPGTPDPVRDFTGLASLVWLGFFFILRPVIGPAADWDLFALPALVFTPGLALRVIEGWRGRPERRLAFGAALAVMAVSLGPWLSVNLREGPSVARFRDLMEWEAPHNDYAASFGYYRLGKWLARSDGPEARAALERAVEINPDSATLRGQVAAVFIALGDQERARDHIFMRHRIKAEYYLGKEKYADAAREYEQALKLRPGDREVIEALIKLYEGPYPRPDKAAELRKMPED